MQAAYSWGGANVSKGPNKCFHLARPFAEPLQLEYGDEIVITLSYSLHGRQVLGGGQSAVCATRRQRFLFPVSLC